MLDINTLLMKVAYLPKEYKSALLTNVILWVLVPDIYVPAHSNIAKSDPLDKDIGLEPA